MYAHGKKCFISVLLMLFFCVRVALGLNEITGDDITISLNPEMPGPNELVTVTLISYATTLDKDVITWKKDGKIVLSGIGQKTYQTTLGGANTSSGLEVTIVAIEDNSTISKQIILQASDLDILWEVPNSYTPPFYRGKALPTQESIIKVVAIPNMPSNQASKNTVYNWKLNRTASPDSSGYGKNIFLFKNSYLNNNDTVAVAASTTSGDYDAMNSVNIPIVNPKIIFYTKDVTGEVNYDNSLSGGLSLNGEGTTILAEPYFLGIKNNMDDFTYVWKINGSKIETPKDPLSLTVRPTSSGGYAIIDLAINSISKLFQSVSSTLKLNL